MSEAPGHDATTLERLIGRLEGAADRLREGELAPEEAAELVERCAHDAAQASAELERLVRAAGAETGTGPPAQDQLL